jgi:hypothetical protein
LSNPGSDTSILYRKPWVIAAIIAVGARIAFWLVTIRIPVINENGQGISPTIARSGIDLHFYVESRTVYADLFRRFLEGPGQVVTVDPTVFLAGPVVPLLMMIFSYGEGNAWPLALAYLGMGCFWSVAWIWWLSARDLPVAWLFIFALLPLPFWFMINVSSDVPFALFVSMFYLIFFRDRAAGPWAAASLVVLAVLALGTRPNGLSIVLFAILILILPNGLTVPIRAFFALLFVAVFAALFGLYNSHLEAFVISSSRLDFFGIPQATYLSGLYGDLPRLIDKPLSWLALLGAKILYLTGLRGSYADTSLLLVLLRGSSGLIFLPGLIRWLAKGTLSERLFLVCFLAPVFLGAAQERYLLAITPVLFFHGALSYRWALAILWARSQRLLQTLR